MNEGPSQGSDNTEYQAGLTGLMEKAKGWAVVKTVSRGEYIFSEGSPYLGPWLINSGSFKVYSYVGESREAIISIVGPGSLIACPPVFLGEPSYHASCQCLQPGEVRLFPKEPFLRLVNQDAQLACFVATTISRYLTNLRRRFIELTEMKAKDRFVEFLKKQDATTGQVRLTLNKNEIAELLSIAPETLSRIISSLKDSGRLIEQDGRVHLVG